ncbi:hypothetical protein JMY81_05365 [Brenneria goodwinii]|uniref:hypothetical protein n=1 Tax=Brenneria goodwinii TaxID=1109412 RepID=UPI000EF2694B|nr:hypothetical protein [Brenneria goodwinii]MCG8156781.1 hypothetical protein [Brenneria goodwinii]MCG8160261.1 hypothetical protein [Brenneria goodwinii]MCG8164784.1 hypothetical protein [Brenneria goodwinii]MCG8172292.1 hypothetical protein [Brenneria goodwinii]MCG8174037.1 hypothetical protein [Brenneria goodwinii]
MADLRGNSTPVPAKYNALLIVAAGLSAIAAVLHVVIIIGGASWYRFFGAGERMASAAAAGQWYPPLVTAIIAFILTIWGLYALSGAGVLQKLPMLKPALCAITAVYLLRGLAIFPRLVIEPDQIALFDIWSSLICLVYGAVHLCGLVQVWRRI